VLAHVYQFKEEILLFFETEGNSNFCEYLSCELWCTKLAYLAEIFGYPNTANTSMQGIDETF
jgi:hypothetical protein